MSDLPWESEDESRPYAHDPNNEALLTAANGIHIIHEEAKNPDELLAANRLLDLTHRVFFLGFGYHRPNLDRLGLRDIDTTGKRLAGTRIGYTDQEARLLCEWLGQRMRSDDMKNCGIIELFREYYPLTS